MERRGRRPKRRAIAVNGSDLSKTPVKPKNLTAIACALSLMAFVAYLSTLSASLDDQDSINFALGLSDFNVVKHQPHPPGYPLYILLGRMVKFFLSDDNLSLTLVNAVFGSLSVFAVYALGREMFGCEIGLAASALAAVTPLFWMNSVMAMTDMVSLFFILTCLLFLFRYLKGKRPSDLYAACFLLGVASSVRIHSVFILLPPLLLIVTLGGKKEAGVMIKGGVILLASIALWVIPVVMASGVENYLSAFEGQLKLRVGIPTVSIIGVPWTIDFLINRLYQFVFFYLAGGYGVDIRKLQLSDMTLLALMALLALLYILKKARHERMQLSFLLASFIPYLIMLYIVLPPSNPRYLLILVPFLCFILASAIWHIKNHLLRYGVFLLLILLTLSHSLPLALEIHQTETPPVQAINYIRNNYPAGTSVLVYLNDNSRKHLIYYAKDLNVVYYTRSCNEVRAQVRNNTVVLGLNMFMGNNAYATQCPGIQAKTTVKFNRDLRVHVKHNTQFLSEIYEQTPLNTTGQ